MRSTSTLLKQAYLWAALVERGFVEAQSGAWKTPDEVAAYIQTHDLDDVLDAQTRALLCAPVGRLSEASLHDATWFCEPLSVLLWVLGRAAFPDQDSDIPPLRVINRVLDPDTPLEDARARPLEEVERARHVLFWRHRRLHAYLRGFTHLDTRRWWEESMGDGAESPEELAWEEGDLAFGGVPMSEFPPHLMPYGADFAKVTGSRLRAIQWVLTPQERFEDIEASPYALDDLKYVALHSPSDSSAASPERFNQWSPRGAIAFYDAIRADDPEAFNALIDRGFDPAQADLDADGCLHHIIRCDALLVSQCLEGADMEWDRAGARGFSPLEMAVRRDDLDMARWLIEQGADPNALGPRRTFPLNEAVHIGQMRHVSALIALGALPDGPPGSTSPIFCAISADHPAMIRALLKYGADPQRPDLSGTPPLLWALQQKRSACAQLLMDEGVDLFARDPKAQSALHWAACTGNIEHLRALLDAGLGLNDRTDSGMTPLLLALLNDHPECARALLEAGADATLCLPSGRSPLHVAAQHKHLDLARALLKAGADPSARAEHDETPLHEAAAGGVVELVELLLDAGAHPDALISNGMSPLHFATRTGRDDVVRALGARATSSIDLQEHEHQWSALHLAILYSELPTIDALLAAGADPNLPDFQGATPLHVAAARRGGPVVMRLRDAGASLMAQDSQGRTPLEWADQNPNPLDVTPHLM